MLEYEVWIRGGLDDLQSARLEAAGMPVQASTAGSFAPSRMETLSNFVRVAAQSEPMARAQVAAVLGVDGDRLRVLPRLR